MQPVEAVLCKIEDVSLLQTCSTVLQKVRGVVSRRLFEQLAEIINVVEPHMQRRFGDIAASILKQIARLVDFDFVLVLDGGFTGNFLKHKLKVRGTVPDQMAKLIYRIIFLIIFGHKIQNTVNGFGMSGISFGELHIAKQQAKNLHNSASAS